LERDEGNALGGGGAEVRGGSDGVDWALADGVEGGVLEEVVAEERSVARCALR